MASDSQPHGSSMRPTASSSSQAEYNAALLLNPRGFAAAPLEDIASKGSHVRGATPVEFEFASPYDHAESSTQAPQPRQSIEQPTTLSNGYGNLIERMNNVEQRSSAPLPKRRKLEGDPETKRGFGAGGGGIIGQHLREKKEEAAGNTSAGKVVTVDLTDPQDDSDVIMVQAPKDEEICYGMIQHAKLNCHLVPMPKPGAKTMMGNGYWPVVKVVLNRKHGDQSHLIQAYDYRRIKVGAVDPSTSSGLAPLLDSPRLQVRTICRINSRPKQPDEIIDQPVSKSYPLDLVLYGPRKSAKSVGRHLSQKNVWLRKPFVYENGVKYENPQELLGSRAPPVQSLARERHMAPSAPQMNRTVEEIRSEVMGVFDSLTKSEDLPEMEPSPIVQTELLKHQKQGLYFMVQKEKPRQLSTDGNSPDSFWQIRLGNNGQKFYHNVITGSSQNERPSETLGGILADMMGLGKTLSILALVAGTMDEADGWAHNPPVQPQAPAPKKNGATPKRFDVPTPEPLALTPVKQNAKTTLLVSPLSTISNWEEQIKAHIKTKQLKYYIYHGSTRIKDAKKLAEYDLVLTTYGSVASEVATRNRSRRPGPCPLEEIGWFRVVLDEAHMIREQSTLQFKAICRLQASRRWAVTGTPVQNKLDDLAALLAFLRLSPFDEKGKFTQYVTAPFKVCDPEIVPKLRVLVDSVTLRRLKDKIDLPPRTDEVVRLHFSSSERKLYELFEKIAQDKVQVLSANREKMLGGKTYIHILQSILRLRLISAHGRDLLNDSDLEMVQGLTRDSAIHLDSDEEDDKSTLADVNVYEMFALMQETNSDSCVMCERRIGSNEGGDIASERDEDIMGYMTEGCYHLICANCITQWKAEVGDRDAGPCSVCNNHLVRFSCRDIRKSKAQAEHEGPRRNKAGGKNRSKDGYAGYSGPHTKTRALMEDLLKSEAQSEAFPDEAPYKSVVFSAWTNNLDLIEIALDNGGISYTRLDGKMSRLARTAALDAFRDDDSIHVMLVSITAGGMGLNLTSANSVYVMEPQYNPAAEAQAVDRVHRLGQKRPVRTVRYIMQNSIEEKMLELQEKKKQLASLSMDRNRVMDKTEAAKQRLMDLRDLFK